MKKSRKIHCKSIANPLQIHCKSILIAFLFSFFSFFSFAQECGTQDPNEAEMQALPWYGNNAWLDQYVDSLSQTFSNCSNCRVEGSEEVWYRVPVQFVVPQWQGRNVIERQNPLSGTDKVLKAMLFHLNRAMRENSIPIRFYMLCPQFPVDQEATTGDLNILQVCNPIRFPDHPTALTCYIINNFSGGSGIHCRYSNNVIFVGAQFTSGNIFEYQDIDREDIDFGNATFIHEVGHWLGLEHTHLHDGVPCLKEPVSRGVFSSVCNLGVPVRHCERRGDALCDTPADPDLLQHSSDIMADCSWFTNIRDDRGDFYAPDTRNYMSYNPNDVCLRRFSRQQGIVALYGVNRQMYRKQTSYFVTQANDFDIYEPDNVPQAASQIRLNETQIHSFSTVGSCSDDSDWLKFNYPANGTVSVIGDLLLEVEAIDGYNFPVLEVEYWDGGASGNYISPNAEVRLSYSNTNITSNKITYKIPCNLPIGRTYLFRVVRNGSQTGRYKVTLKGLPANAQIIGKETACGNTTYRISPSSGQVMLPLTWQVSANLQIVSGQGTSELVVAPINAATSDWGFVRAIFNNTCTGQQQIHKSIWVGRPKIMGGVLANNSDELQLINQTGTIEDTLYYQFACPFETPPRPIYDKICVYTNGAFGYNIYEIEDIIGNASQRFAYGGNPTCFGFLEEGYYEFRIRAKNEECTPATAYSDWLLFKITVLQDPNEPYCEPPPIEPPDVCYDEWGQAYLCPSGLRYFPNTSSGELNVEYNANYVKLELHNKYGQKVREADLERYKNKKINLQNLPDDVYFLHLIDRSGARVQRQVVLQK